MSLPRYFPHLYAARAPEYELRRRVAYEQPDLDDFCADVFGEAFAGGVDRDFFRTPDSHVTLLDSREVAGARLASPALRNRSLVEVEDTLIAWAQGHEDISVPASGFGYAMDDGRGYVDLGVMLTDHSDESIEVERELIVNRINTRKTRTRPDSHGRFYLTSQPRLTFMHEIDPVVDADIVTRFFDKIPLFTGKVVLESMWLEQPQLDYSRPDLAPAVGWIP